MARHNEMEIYDTNWRRKKGQGEYVLQGSLRKT